MEVSFCASGHVKQIVQITDPEWIDHKKVEAGFKNGNLATSIQEGDGEVIIVLTQKVIGKVILVTNCLSYEDFEVRTP